MERLVTLTASGESADVCARGSNQLLLKSKKQWSDQLQEEAKRMTSRKEQYTHGRLRKYVHTKKRQMNIGEALVGRKRSGSQLGERLAI